ncbi:MAG: phosphopyruvate hydratase [Patescibacteria group bacterium]
MPKIKKITASEILNGYGVPTVEAKVFLDSGSFGVASFPSGKGGIYDALELVDHDAKRFAGQGVLKAVGNILSPIAPSLVGKDALNQPQIDKKMIELDGTPNKSRLGANAIFTVSMAVAKAAATSSNLPLYLYLRQFLPKTNPKPEVPIPLLNLINGAVNPNNQLSDFNEFLIVPASFKSYEESLQICSSVHSSLIKELESKNLTNIRQNEDITTQNFSSNKEALLFLKQAVENISMKHGFDVFFGVNSKANNFFNNGKYQIRDSSASLSSDDLINFYEELSKSIHLLYFEDPFSQDDWTGWENFLAKFSQRTIIAGCDLTATNLERLQIALDKKLINAIVIKPSQVGTVTESLAIAHAGKAMGLKIIVSHRSNETNDDFISDFAVAVSSDYVKLGSLTRGENISKYNRLLQIDSQLKVL